MLIDIFIDLDDTVFDFTKAFNEKVKQTPGIQFPQSQYGFFENLEPIEDAIVSLELLMKSKEYNPWILTAPSELNPLCYTEKRNAVAKHLGMEYVKRLIISPYKGHYKGILIDDNIEGKGQDEFNGELIQFGSKRFPNWLSVINHLNPTV